MDAFDQSALSASITFFNPELALTQHHHTHHPHLQQQQLHVHHQLSQPPLHHQQPLSQPQSQAQTPTIVHHGPRKYKSRKSRPCDMCRQRQISCKIDVAPPCAFCSTHQRPCTFIERPKKKKRPTTYACDNDANNNSFVSPLDPSMTLNTSNNHLSNGYLQAYDEHIFGRMAQTDPFMQTQQSSPTVGDQVGMENDISPEYSSRNSSFSHGLPERSLESEPTQCARFIGQTGESNPYLLQHYQYDMFDQCTVSKLTYRRVKRRSHSEDLMSRQSSPPPVFFMLADDSLSRKGEPRIEEDVLAKAREDIFNWIPPDEGLRLIDLYFRFVDPYFPILSKTGPTDYTSIQTLNKMPLSLLSAVYATALPFILYDDLLSTTLVHTQPTTHQLFRYTWLAIMQEMHTPRLATLQACLLLLQRAPTNRYTTDTPFKTSLVGWTVNLAYSLGLNRECSDWVGIPIWELSLRKRLWYAVFIMDKWASLGAGAPSSIRSEDVDVLPLTAADCETSGSSRRVSDEGSVRNVGVGVSGPIPSLSVGVLSLQSPLTPTDPSGISMSLPPHPSHLTESTTTLSIASHSHFRRLAELTTILSDIVDAFYTVRASTATAHDFARSLELAHGLNVRLCKWRDERGSEALLRRQTSHPHLNISIPSETGVGGGGGGAASGSGSGTQTAMGGHPSLTLAYIVASMTLYRALLRPIENLSVHLSPSSIGSSSMGLGGVSVGGTVGGLGPSSGSGSSRNNSGMASSSSSLKDANENGTLAVRAGALECAKEVVEFAEGLGRGALDAFWHSWSRANFALASSFLLQLLLTPTSTEEEAVIRDLVERWRWAMRVSSGGSGGGNGWLSLGLLRLDSYSFAAETGRAKGGSAGGGGKGGGSGGSGGGGGGGEG